ncbi:hypothetical protein GTA08_BOTSDO14165 [Neofusicoccum parvum]|nr:hypothetical protein GTA08_BOTSDO14165 [Neofusicoccum parvum]
MPQGPRPILPAVAAPTPTSPAIATPAQQSPSSSSSINTPDPTQPGPASSSSAADLLPAASAAQQARARGRRTVTLVACFECQKKKTKCDGQRPNCGRCAAKGARCMWETDSREQTRQQATYNKLEEAVLKLEDANAKILHYERLLAALRADPEPAAVALFWRLRAGSAAEMLPPGMELGVQGMAEGEEEFGGAWEGGGGQGAGWGGQGRG